MTPKMPPGRKGGICVSIQYYLKRGSRAKVKFLPVMNGTTREALRSSYVQVCKDALLLLLLFRLM